MSFEYAIHDISYANLLMYCSVLPSYDFDKDKKDKNGKEIIDGDDPKNRNKVLAIIRGEEF